MSRVRSEGIDQFHERLEEFKRSSKASLSIKDVVAKSMRRIQEARNHGATWDDIAQILNESFQTEEGRSTISGKTIQGYYTSILKERQRSYESPVRTRAQEKRGKTTANSRPRAAELPAQVITSEPDLQESEGSQDKIPSFNGSSSEPDTNGQTMTGISDTHRSRFNFNSVRPT